MSLPWFRKTAWLAFGLALLTASCADNGRAPESPLAPALHDYTTDTDYTPVRDLLPLSVSLSDLTTSKLIGISGGTVTLLGHSINVPSGAVVTPSIFTIVVLSTGYVEVSLLELVPNLLGGLKSIGEYGFLKPVTLSLTYSRSPDPIDPSRLVILYNNGTSVQPLATTVNTTTKTASAQLKHFSKYCLAEN